MSKLELQKFSHDQSTYERPTLEWVCARSGKSRRCARGPDASGRCVGEYACAPRRVGDRYECTRSGPQGGRCERGPLPDGACCIRIPPCQPVRSHRSRRRFVGWMAAAATFGGLLLLLGGSARTRLLSPGPLSLNHAQILESDNGDTCGTCHAAGAENALGWLSMAASEQKTQTALCLECHRESPGFAEHAAKAHSADPARFVRLDVASGSRGARLEVPHSASGDIACATCHREHHGAQFDLERLADDACQGCHRETFASLGGGHPEFTDWPYQTSGTRIAFSHQEHQQQHFSDREFDCAGCHELDRLGESMRIRGFEAACGECHVAGAYAGPPPEPFGVGDVPSGVAVLQLPAIDTDAVVDLEIGEWPELAGMDHDEPLGGFMRLLVRASADLEHAAEVDEMEYLYDLDGAEQADVVWAIKDLFYALASQNPADGLRVLCERLERSLERKLSSREISFLAANLSTDTLVAAQRAWFPSLMEEVERRAAGEPVATRLISLDELDPPTDSAMGGWYRDDSTFALRYRPSGHADPFLKSWLDVVIEGAARDPSLASLIDQIAQPDSAGRCIECHTKEARSDSEGAPDRSEDAAHGSGFARINWQPKRRDLEERSFTRYFHRPHLLQPGLDGCGSCHVSELGGETPKEGDFFAMTKETCAGCHTPEAAGDSCLTCHNYHVGVSGVVRAVRRGDDTPVGRFMARFGSAEDGSKFLVAQDPIDTE